MKHQNIPVVATSLTLYALEGSWLAVLVTKWETWKAALIKSKPHLYKVLIVLLFVSVSQDSAHEQVS